MPELCSSRWGSSVPPQYMSPLRSMYVRLLLMPNLHPGSSSHLLFISSSEPGPRRVTCGGLPANHKEAGRARLPSSVRRLISAQQPEES